MALLYSIHDRDGHPLIPAGGWVVDAVLVTDTPPDYARIRGDINWIVRLNHGWYPNGTIPLRPEYPAYAKRCADFAARCRGVKLFIVSNEPNHRQEYPNGTPIAPQDYADCFNLCYQAITYERPDAEVCVAAVAPWDNTSGIDWLSYYRQMLAAIVECDGLAVHGYTHGADPNLIWSMEQQHGWYWHFPVIYQIIQAIPPKFADRPVHVTETDQGDDAWLDANTGWVQNAYQSVNEHNHMAGSQKVFSLALYRWRGDKYEIHNKNGVQDDFCDAVRRQYPSPSESPTPPTPEPPGTPGVPTPPAPDPARDIDPALAVRGVTFEYASVPAGTGYWRIVAAAWLDEQEADAVGPDHHILGTIVFERKQIAGVPLTVTWPNGSARVTSKSDQPNATYNYDYPMSASLNEFSITVADGSPSDAAHGIGMGAGGNPRIHTSTWIEFEWTISEAPDRPPLPPLTELTGHLIWPVSGPVTQWFGEGDAAWGQKAHNGIDIAVAEGTPVAAIADGVVMFSGWDDAYGYYCRIFHPTIHSHSFVAHLSSIDCAVGEPVNQGAWIAHSGNTGNSTGPHVHFELRAGNKDGYYHDVTVGYTQGRYNPVDAYVVTGSARTP